MTEIIDPIAHVFAAYDAGHPAILLSGRSLYELAVDDEEKVRPILEMIRRRGRHLGMVCITYSRANGIEYDSHRMDPKEHRIIDGALKAHQLIEVEQNEHELPRVMRGLSSLCRTPTEGLTWADGKQMKFLVVIEFTEHNFPGGMQNGTQLETQILAIQHACLLGQSLALRSSGNFLIFHSTNGGALIDDQVAGALHHIHMRQPDSDEKCKFLPAATAIYKEARFEDGLTPEVITNLTAGTPNRSLEEHLRESHRSGKIITAKALAERKARDVEALSEQTLRVLDTSRIKDVQLVGRNIEAPKRVLERFAELLRHVDPHMPGNVLLVGSPATGKTDLALYTAALANVVALEMVSPKGSFVGETERRARLQHDILMKEMVPNLAFCDEINSVMPFERSGMAGDSGASQAVFAAFLTALSDTTKRGKSLLIGTTNDPNKMSDAMRSRFTVIPVLSPLKEDFPAIVASIGQRLGVSLNSDDPRIQQASLIFFEKGANPRKIREALDNAILIHQELTPEMVLFAAHDLCVAEDRSSAIHADLVAVRATSLRSFLPWGANPARYPFPDHLQGIIDDHTGEINERELQKRIKEFEPYANV